MSSGPPATICFSDIDGTLVHYCDHPSELCELTGDIIHLPQSTTGKTGFLSHLTLQRVAELRKAGTLFVLLTGARTSTLLQRLPYLPAADAFASENGGRLWYPDTEHGLTACPLREDAEWRATHAAVAGAADQELRPPLERQGLLWDWYRQLHGQGWRLDANSYSTCFRLLRTEGKTQEQLQALIDTRPPELSCTWNLGVADFYPSTSGKAAVARYLMQRHGAAAADCVFLCDDDNDLELAGLVGKAFVPSIGSASMEAAIQRQPHQFFVSKTRWTGGTEEALEAAMEHLRHRQPTGQQAAPLQ